MIVNRKNFDKVADGVYDQLQSFTSTISNVRNLAEISSNFYGDEVSDNVKEVRQALRTLRTGWQQTVQALVDLVDVIDSIEDGNSSEEDIEE